MIPLRAVLIASLVLLTPSVAQSQAYPNRPVRIVVPFPPGGLTDIVARFIGDHLSKTWSQSVLIENRAGAGGTIGTDNIAKSPPDGYSLLLATLAANSIAPSVYPKLPYDAEKDFTPIMALTGTPSVIAINPSIPAQTLKEFVAYVKTVPNGVPFSSPGTGVSAHLGMELFAARAGIKMTHVPYKGSAPALNAVVAGEVTATFDPITTVAPLVKANRLRALAMSGTKRSSLLPDVPTIDESGLKGVESYAWNGLMGPAGMPAEIVKKINRDAGVALNSPELRERMNGMGTEILDMGPEAFAAFVKVETKKWGEIAHAVGASVQ